MSALFFLRTCKHIHTVAKSLVFELNTFTADFERLAKFSGRTQDNKALGRSTFWKILVKVVRPLWEKIMHLEMRWDITNLVYGDGGNFKHATSLFKSTGIQLQSLHWAVGETVGSQYNTSLYAQLHISKSTDQSGSWPLELPIQFTNYT